MSLYAAALMVLNLLLGRYLQTYETVDLKENGQFFPATRWDEYYAQEGNIDVLVLGSSHAYRSYHPTVLEDNLNEATVFNFGSSGQNPLTSYYVLDEVLRMHRPAVVIMDVYIMVFAENRELSNARINLISMRPGPGRRNFFSEGFPLKHKVLSLFPSYQYRAHAAPKLKKLLGMRYLRPHQERYVEKGFVELTDTITLTELQQVLAVTKPVENLDFVTESSIAYLEKIKERCAAAGIPLVLTVSPIPEMAEDHMGIYGQANAYFGDLAEKWEVPYYDFIRDRLPILKDEHHYSDDHHLNAAGARIYSKAIAPIIQKHAKWTKASN
ncbi:MAG: hypothetical protein AAFP77_26380 [Bacteroidota bacterium]